MLSSAAVFAQFAPAQLAEAAGAEGFQSANFFGSLWEVWRELVTTCFPSAQTQEERDEVERLRER